LVDPGAGAIFAAWPAVYAAAFSGFYLAMFIVLCALILRPVGFKYRSKRESPLWRGVWDWMLFLGGLIPALIFGVAVGNALLGAPFAFDDTLRMTYHGTFLELLSPYALLCGCVSVAMLTMHGGNWLVMKVEGPVAARARVAAIFAALVLILLFAAAGGWTAALDAYRISAIPAHDAASNPLGKTVVRETGAWLANYRSMPWTMAAPAVGFLGAALAAAAAWRGHDRLAFVFSGMSVAGVIATAGFSMFPFILPSSLHPSSSLTVWDASSSRTTLLVMLIAVVLLLPVVLAYTAFIYRVLRGKISGQQVKEHSASY
jgi:cytochrome d ubiquinol oxidase subunit II